MSPFKEPQPRKNSATEDAKKVIGGNWPPYAREGGEANWTEPTPAEKFLLDQTEPQWTMTETEFHRELKIERDAGHEEGRAEGRAEVLTDLDYRKAALEAALTHAKTRSLDLNAERMSNVAGVFEEYLRNGKPS